MAPQGSDDMSKVISLESQRAAREARKAQAQGYTLLPDGGIRLAPDSDINELRRVWRSMKEDLEVYRDDMRRAGGVPFSDL